MNGTVLRGPWRAGAVASAVCALLLLGVALPASSVSSGEGPAAMPVGSGTFGYRANARGDSRVVGATAKPPFKKLWQRDLGSVVSAPVAVGGQVFAVVNADQGGEGGPRMELVGLDAATGRSLWPQRFLTSLPNATVTYGGGCSTRRPWTARYGRGTPPPGR
ncbi:hypothetical protein [Streptomyces sp. NBC_00233]|uniref:hypothetical protein n=1 Tax=Streptomyces sp. NBC_00233 TaxID=2975686 RepID=UPI0022520504|nr:hypothetical protein [Streptomyces sp. NBC_00233]MCX5231402.1 hypothetical protein [Streptomyces sp. NBC_00233]